MIQHRSAHTFWHIIILVITLVLLFLSSSLPSLTAAAASSSSSPNRRKARSTIIDDTMFRIRETPRQHESETATSDGVPLTNVSHYTNGAHSCRLPRSCAFFSDVLLVVKLNPVRMLWLDNLLRLYSLGFPHIVFYAPLRKPSSTEDFLRHNKKNSKGTSPAAADAAGRDHNTREWLSEAVQQRRAYHQSIGKDNKNFLLVGQHDVRVSLVDDNFGFCDHETVANAMVNFPDFDGYLFLSDDVLLQFWRLAAAAAEATSEFFDKRKSWRQKMTSSTKMKRTQNHQAAWDEVMQQYPDLLRGVFSSFSNARNIVPFASTSGVYYVPTPRDTVVGAVDRSRFIVISGILANHRTYNEFGTPFLLHCVDRGSFQALRGKLVWGHKRHLAVKIPQKRDLWWHPVRASGELFARVSDLVAEEAQQQQQQLMQRRSSTGNSATTVTKDGSSSSSSSKIMMAIDHTIFYRKCMDCATHPMQDRTMKSLLHSCVPAASERDCDDPNNDDGANDDDHHASSGDNNLDVIGKRVSKLWPIMGGAHIRKLVAGRFVVRPARSQVSCPLELKHEGFWNAEVVAEVFEQFYPKLNSTKMRSAMWETKFKRDV